MSTPWTTDEEFEAFRQEQLAEADARLSYFEAELGSPTPDPMLDLLVAVREFIVQEVRDFDHRDCQRGDHDVCDCHRLPDLAAQYEIGRVLWQGRLDLLDRQCAEMREQADVRLANLGAGRDHWVRVRQQMAKVTRDSYEWAQATDGL